MKASFCCFILAVLAAVCYTKPATPDTNAVTCPRFPTRYEGDALVIEIEKGECEMIVAAVNMHNKNADKLKPFRKRFKAVLRKVNLPAVSFRPLMTISQLGSNSVPATNTLNTRDNVTETSNMDNPNTSSKSAATPVDEVAKSCTSIGYRFVGPVLVIDTIPGECQIMVVAHLGRKHNMMRRLNRKGKPKKPRKKIMFDYVDEPFF